MAEEGCFFIGSGSWNPPTGGFSFAGLPGEHQDPVNAVPQQVPAGTVVLSQNSLLLGLLIFSASEQTTQESIPHLQEIGSIALPPCCLL